MATRPQAGEQLRLGQHPLFTFHWQIEFPEVFARENGGFDAIFGNPPFAGKNTLINGNHEYYVPWIQSLHEGAHGNSDLVAHFFRRTFNLIRESGTLGLIATNTISQGDTRTSGLRWICNNGGSIYSAIRQFKWPGMAAVTVSVIHLIQSSTAISRSLDGRQVEKITAFLFHDGTNDDPLPLRRNLDRCLQGAIAFGSGFIFDDTDESTNSLEEMRKLQETYGNANEVIFPYLGGDEILNDPRQMHFRFAIDFGLMDEEKARSYGRVFEIVESGVKPMRLAQNRQSRAKYWWRWGETAPALRRATANLTKSLCHPFTATYLSFCFVPTSTILAGPHYRLTLDSYAAFAPLQSRLHELWVRFFSSSMEDRLRYAPSDSFDTFPFTDGFEKDSKLEVVGRNYYDERSSLMIRNNEGLTKTYNRFHDPDERSADILKLRELHAAMDRAVLDAYGWTDIPTDCQFLLDYEEDEDVDTDTQLSPKRGKGKKKPWRYRWPDEVRDEVLARLLALNAERAKEEAAELAMRPKQGRKKSTRSKDSHSLFDQ